MARKITVAELLVKVGVDSDQAQRANDKLAKGFQKVEKRGVKLGDGMKSLGRTVAVAGAAIAAAATGVLAFVNSTSKAFDEVAKGADKTGLAVEEFQKFKFAADRSGVSMDVFARAVKNQSRFIDDAINSPTGVTAFTTALSKVGLTLEDVQAEDGFGNRINLIADALKSVEDPAQRVALAMKLVGEEAGPQLLPLLKDGAEGIEALKDQAVDLGAVLSEDVIRSGEAFQDSLTNTKALIGGVANTIGADLIPVAEEMIKGFGEWVKVNRRMIRQRVEGFFRKVMIAVERLLPVFESVGKALMLLVENFDTLLLMFAAGKISQGFVAIATGLRTMKIAASGAAGPLGLIVTTLATMIPLLIEAGNALGDVMGADGTNVSRKRESAAPASAKTNKASAKLLALEARRRDLNTSDERVLPFKLRQLDMDIKSQRGRLEASRAEDAARAQKEKDDLDRDFPLIQEDERDFTPTTPPGPKPKPKDKAKRFSIDSIADVVEGAATGQLGMIADRTPSTKGLEPTVALEITNNNVTVSLENAFHGIEASAVVPTVRAAVREEFTSVLSIAGQKLAGNIQR